MLGIISEKTVGGVTGRMVDYPIAGLLRFILHG